MDINVTRDNDCCMIKLGGFFDTPSSPELQRKVEDIASETFGKGGLNFVFDLEDVEFLSSAGLRVLLLAKKLTDKQNGKMAVINVRQSIREIFNMTGFSKIFNLR